MIKLMLTWNLRPGKEGEYFEFLARDFVRLIMAMNLHPLEAWYSVWGRGPQVITGGVAEDLETVTEALEGAAWAEFQEVVSGFAADLTYKVVEAIGGFQL